MKERKPAPKLADIELRPDGWERFEKAVDAAVESGPKPKPKLPRKRGRPKRMGECE
jgi:hypothetical protein